MEKAVKSGDKLSDHLSPCRVCAICGRDNTKIKVFNRHHLRYDPPEIVVDLCLACHSRLHGRVCYNHPFEKVYGKDLGPFMFACAVTGLYVSRLGMKGLLERVANLELANAANEIYEKEK